MKKVLLIFLIISSANSCKQKECLYPISKIVVFNKATYFYGGKEKLVLTDKEKIQIIDSFVRNLNKQKSTKASVNLNSGFLEVLYSTENCRNQPYLDIIFTDYSGTVIRNSSKIDKDYGYYVDDKITNFFLSLMDITERK